jgi:hypothetical protein
MRTFIIIDENANRYATIKDVDSTKAKEKYTEGLAFFERHTNAVTQEQYELIKKSKL